MMWWEKKLRRPNQRLATKEATKRKSDKSHRLANARQCRVLGTRIIIIYNAGGKDTHDGFPQHTPSTWHLAQGNFHQITSLSLKEYPQALKATNNLK